MCVCLPQLDVLCRLFGAALKHGVGTKLAAVKAWLHVTQANLSAGIWNADEPVIGTTDLVAFAFQRHLRKRLQPPDDFAHISSEEVPVVEHMLSEEYSAAEK